MSNKKAVAKKNTNTKSSKKSKVILKVVKGKKSAKKKNVPLSDSDVEDLILEHRANARKIARSILRRWQARIDIEELDSLVDLALCEAARKYDPNKGASFITFLFYHLRGSLVRAVNAAANLNTLPAAEFEVAELSSDYGAADPNGSGRANDMAQALNNREYMMPDEILYRKELAVLSNAACAKLDSLEQEVIYRIYALEESLIDIARSLGYSRCHISRVKKRALEVLHANLSPVIEGVSSKSQQGGRIRCLNVQRRSVVRRKLNGRELTLSINENNTLQKLAAQLA